MPLVRVAVPFPLPDRETLVYELPDEEEFRAGLRVLVPVGPRRVLGTVLDLEPKRPSFRVRRIAGIPEPRLVLTEELLGLCRWIADYYACTLGEVLHAAAPSPRALTRRAPRMDVVEEEGWHATEPPRREALNRDQRAALEALEAALGDPGFHPFLLYGVTGSGKTAVFLHAALEAVRRGGQALILVPEIALSPQALDAFRRSGLQRVALYHSTLRPRERAEAWRSVAAGEIDLVVGTRSAVLLPFRDLRLLVVDEEQDGAYKQEEAPRYHARDVALVRAQRLGATAILSSATPSMESYARAKQGTYGLLSLPDRVDGRPLATVRVADLRSRGPRGAGAAPGERGTGPASFASRHLSPILLNAMARTLERKEQAILFLNRRGHSTYLQCRGCGAVAQCERCDVSLTVHAEDSTLRCHYCGSQRKLTPDCRGCGATDLWFGGVGIQKVEREVARAFPGARLARLDFDSVRRRGAAAAILGAFRDGRTDFLLGTQMVTKGFHFPGVTLVGIILADLQLHLPDFRAAERTFQLLTQVAGRAGRGESPGEVIMQSYDPDHPALRCAAAQDYATFFDLESAERRELEYPPYGHLVELEVRGRVKERVVSGAAEVKRLFARGASGSGVSVLGPAPRPLSRIKSMERWHVLLRSASRKAMRDLLERSLPAARTLRLPGVHLAIDVDPRQLL
jgi:primosomal protein N' (replication factor Y) (superfamily II helicase)